MKKRSVLILPLSVMVLGFFAYVTVDAVLTALAKPVEPEAKAVKTPEPSKSKYEVGPPDAQEMLELVNAERAKAGVAPLTIDERLMQSAQRKADDMAIHHYFAHQNFDGSRGIDYIFNTTGNECIYGSENLHSGTQFYATSQGTIDGWKGSEPHNKAMLSDLVFTTGFGIVNDGGTYKVVQHFCRPR